MIRSFIALAVGAMLSTAAIASEPTPAPLKSTWTGFYIGAHGGMDMASTELSVAPFALDGLASNGMGFGGNAGYDYQLPGTPLVIGIGADYTWSNNEFSVSPNLLTAGIDNSWAIYGRLGYDMGRVMPYILAGYSEADASASIPLVPITVGTTMKGWLAGAGMELTLGNGLFLAGEYRYTRFDTVNIGGFLNLDTDRHEVRAALKYKFSM